jgi:sugar phosphate isomerase/epimerase
MTRKEGATVTPAIGLQLYTLREALAEPGSRPAVLERVAALGVESVEPFGFARPNLVRADRLAEARALRADADAAGLRISSVHTPLPGPEEADWLFEALAEAGAPVAVVPVPEGLAGFARDAFADADTVRRYADRLSRVADVAAGHDAEVGYHNHWWEWEELPGGSRGYDLLWEHMDPRVVAEVDLYWAQAAGQAPADVVRRLGSRVALVHVKDGPATLERPPQQVAPGRGVVALDEALSAGADSITTHIIEADAVAADGDPFAYIEEGVSWLRQRS